METYERNLGETSYANVWRMEEYGLQMGGCVQLCVCVCGYACVRDNDDALKSPKQFTIYLP